jgi:butyrate kinase
MASGTYLVDDVLLEQLHLAKRGDHASNLGGVLAAAFANEQGVKAYIVDPVSVDEREDLARLSGSPLLPRNSFCHALNTKAIAKRYAREVGKKYADLNLIVIHLGSGNSISAHHNGLMLDNNSGEEGPFGVDRSGAVPIQPLIKLCYSGKFTEKQMLRQAQGEGGVLAYLGTRDMFDVENRAIAGEKEAKTVFDAMIYQVAKEAGGMAVVLRGKVDAILLTGGMARSKYIVKQLEEYLGWMAPLKIYPGEDELLALTQGVFRVLTGEEQAHTLKV